MPDRPARPRKPTKRITQKFEVTYMFHPTDRWLAEHWIYCEVTGSSPEDCVQKAKKYYENQMKSLGWTKIATLKSIGPLRHVDDKAPRKTNPDIDSPGGDVKSGIGRESNRKNSSKSRRSNSGTKSSTTSTKESRKNREDASTTRTGNSKSSGSRSNTTRKKRS